MDETGLPGTQLSDVVAVSAGRDNTCALLEDTTMRCWGWQFAGVLGDGQEPTTFDAVTVPRPVVDLTGDGVLSGVTAISVASTLACALRNGGDVACWGRNWNGGLGNPTLEPIQYSIPQSVDLPPATAATAITVGAQFGCALLEDSTVWCWGQNSYGQLGRGTASSTGAANPAPVQVNGTDLTGVLAVSAGFQHVCALVDEGTETAVLCWGEDFWGQLGDGDPEPAANAGVPVRVRNLTDDGSLAGATAVTVQESHSCALVEGGGAVCWGRNNSQQLGSDLPLNGGDHSTIPVPVQQLDTNRPPTADPQTVEVLAGTPETITLSGSDRDGDSLSFAITTPPTGGSLSAISVPVCVDFVCTATVDYTPNAGTVDDSFDFTVDDGYATSDPATVTITVEGNRTPIANDDAAQTDEDVAVTVDVAANDTDPDDNLDPTTATVVTGPDPDDGTVANNGNGTFTYTPKPDVNGDAGFTYQICDTGGLCDDALVTISVTPVPDAPTAVDDAASVAEDASVDVAVLANDFDVDGEALSVTGVSDPPHGTATVNSGSTVTYTPDADFCGEDSFTYTIEDVTERSDTATVSVVVDCVEDPPMVDAGGPYTGEEGEVVNIPGSVTDPDSDPMRYWSYTNGLGVDAGASCSFADPSNASTTVTCDDDGTFILSLTAEDGVNPPVVAETELVLANRAPAVDPGPDQSVNPGDAVTVEASFTDPGRNDTHTATVDWDDGNGPQPALVDDDAGTVTATLAGGYPVATTAIVSIEVCDDDEGCDMQTLTVAVDICTHRGTAAGETIRGTEGDDVICGLGGDDTLYGLGGNDTIFGGSGNDRIIGGPGNDIMIGGQNSFDILDDTWRDPTTGDRVSYADATNGVIVDLRVTTPQDTGWGEDTIIGFENIFGSEHDDVLHGNELRNVIWGAQGSDEMHGHAGRDRIFGAREGENENDRDDLIFGGADGDWILAGQGKDWVYGQAGNDDISGNKGDDILWGGIGNDTLRGNDGKDEVHGGPGDDFLYGFAGRDTLWGDAGDDLVSGGAGTDKVYGGIGGDNVQGGAGDRDKVYGTGPDQIDNSTDILNGGSGRGDKCIGSPTRDTWSLCRLKIEPA